MLINPDNARERYKSLSDEALLAIDRSELTTVAQSGYDSELAARGFADEARPRTRSRDGADSPDTTESSPDWLADAAEVFSAPGDPGGEPAPKIEDAREALEAAGIPCHLVVGPHPEVEEDPQAVSYPEWRLLVPGDLNQQAMSILDRDIFNQEFEDEWRTHLQELSDAQVLEMAPKEVFCGLFDRIERVERVYAEELDRRSLKSAHSGSEE